MKIDIKAVIVVEVPKTCGHCSCRDSVIGSWGRSRDRYDDHVCRLFHLSMSCEENRDRRHPDCLLLTAEQYAFNVHLVTELEHENLTLDEWNAKLTEIRAIYAEGVKNDKINWDWLNGVERGRE